MYILRFTVENHGSFRNEAELSLVQRRLRTSRPLDGKWADYTSRVAALYGANASGKSQLLDGLRYFQAMVQHSATTWVERKHLPRSYFRLDKESRERPSSYVLDFVLDDTRFEYGFSVTADSIDGEWLYFYPTGRKRVLFERDRDGGLEFGRALKGGEVTLGRVTGSRELALSKGAVLKNRQLSRIAHHIVDRIDIAKFGEMDREQRLRAFTNDLSEGVFALEDLRTMLKVADVGIAGADVAEKEADPAFTKVLRAVYQATDHDVDDDQLSKILAETSRVLLFEHLGLNDTVYSLPSELQSTGTLTWLSLAAPAIAAIKNGGVLVVDELDASLHPQLAQVMIQMFKDETVNRRYAQLIFTTHDTYFMSPTSDVRLTPEEVFLVEKNREGVSEVFSLADFPTRKEQNLSRRYLQGRYGAVPAVAPAFLESLVDLDGHGIEPDLDEALDDDVEALV